MSLIVATYNVLADSYIKPAYYPLATPEQLDTTRRTPRLVERISGLGADVVCLQEVEGDFFRAASAGLPGLKGRFEPKGQRKPDGCAILSRRPVAAHRSVRFSDGTGHVALLVEIEEAGRRVGVATTHLRWGTEFAGQAAELLDVLDGDWIVCGDFNAEPSSAVCAEFRRRGFVDAFEACGGATCNSNRVAKRIDFLFHSPTLRATPTAPRPITGVTPLPSAEEPSDHLPIVAAFQWI